MDFTNHQISSEQLPRMEAVSLEPLEPAYLTTQKIAIALTTVVLLGAAAVLYFTVDELRQNTIFFIVTGVVLLLMCIVYAGIVISFRMKGYAIRDKDVLYRSGWIVQKTRVLPLNRVQHVSVQSGPIERRFHLGSVSLYTAGNEGADFSIKGLKQEKANQIKDWISGQLNDEQSHS